jgi:membrane protease YdiL (CAAX protease family)
MPAFILQTFVYLCIALLLFGTGSKHEKIRYIPLLLLAGYFVSNQVLLNLPLYYPGFKFIASGWNWSGKILAFVGSLVFYLLLRKRFGSYIVFFNKPVAFHKFTIACGIVLLALVGIALVVTIENKPLFDSIVFQSIAPGLEEELAFRGIITGLLIAARHNRKTETPIVISAVLFGLVHSLKIDDAFGFSFNYLYMANTFIIGWIYGYIASKSRSLVLPVILHNIYNVVVIILR